MTVHPGTADTSTKSRLVLRAHNYAEASDNKMHSDAVAERYGFRGGLVPGVALYAYMTQPIAERFGRTWLERGSMSGKFISPVYDGEQVAVQCTEPDDASKVWTIELRNSGNELCAVGEASMNPGHTPPRPSDYLLSRVPPSEDRVPPTVEALEHQPILGSHEFAVDLDELPGEFALFVEEMRDPLPIYRGPDPVLHPAYVVAKANRLLVENVALGPWIHTASETQHYGSPRHGERVCLRGGVDCAYEKRGHTCVELDLAMFGQDERALARIRHRAIIRPHEPA